MHFWALVLIFAAVAASGAFARPAWPGEIFLSLLPQIGLAGLVASLLLFGLGRPLQAVALIVCAAFCFTSAKGMLGGGSLTKEPHQARILWANVFGKTDSFKSVLNQAQKRDADLVIIAEAPASTNWRELAAAYSEYKFVRGAITGEDAAISVFSSIPIRSFEPVDVTGRKSALIEAEISGNIVVIGAVHPTIPSTPGKLQRRNNHIRQTAKRLGEHQIKLLLGDFNTVPWSPVIKEIREKNELKRLRGANASTWISTLPIAGLPIDLAFASENIIADVYSGDAMGSDHFPLILDISVRAVDVDDLTQ